MLGSADDPVTTATLPVNLFVVVSAAIAPSSWVQVTVLGRTGVEDEKSGVGCTRRDNHHGGHRLRRS
jgi:hypothetical protein